MKTKICTEHRKLLSENWELLVDRLQREPKWQRMTDTGQVAFFFWWFTLSSGLHLKTAQCWTSVVMSSQLPGKPSAFRWRKEAGSGVLKDKCQKKCPLPGMFCFHSSGLAQGQGWVSEKLYLRSIGKSSSLTRGLCGFLLLLSWGWTKPVRCGDSYEEGENLLSKPWNQKKQQKSRWICQ